MYQCQGSPARKAPCAEAPGSVAEAERRREQLAEQIRERALGWSLGRAEPGEIDSINILQASLLAMQRAVAGLAVIPELVLVDGNCCPELPYPAQAVVKGDDRVAAISAASILAKVERDREMVEMDGRYPGYGLAKHKGYPSKAHMEALETLGITPIHRRSYAPVGRIAERDGG